MWQNFYFTEKSDYETPPLKNERRKVLEVVSENILFKNEIKIALGFGTAHPINDELREFPSLLNLYLHLKKMHPVRYAQVLRSIWIDISKFGIDLTPDLKPSPKIGQIWLMDTPYGDYNLKPERLFVIVGIAIKKVIVCEVQQSCEDGAVKLEDDNFQKGRPLYVNFNRDVAMREDNLNICIASLNENNAWRVSDKIIEMQRIRKESFYRKIKLS